ncbi:MAG TPA: hypothetical protein VNZ06_09505 [Steroidobacteraceae bacterium]|nr:hypothetical protein [Steroidobacteraceae bacterium]
MGRTWLIVLGLAAAAAIGLYAWTFGPNTAWLPSAHTQDWARFGEFVGGVFGMLALVGVLVTVEQQRRTLEWHQNQTTLDELLREARDLATIVETILAARVETVALTAQQLSVLEKPSTVSGVLELVDARAASEVGRPMPPPAENKSAYRKAVAGSIAGLSQKLDLLAAVLSEFVSRGGDTIFLLFYRDRFRATVQRLIGLEIAVSTGDWWIQSSEESESRRWRF